MTPEKAQAVLRFVTRMEKLTGRRVEPDADVGELIEALERRSGVFEAWDAIAVPPGDY